MAFVVGGFAATGFAGAGFVAPGFAAVALGAVGRGAVAFGFLAAFGAGAETCTGAVAAFVAPRLRAIFAAPAVDAVAAEDAGGTEGLDADSAGGLARPAPSAAFFGEGLLLGGALAPERDWIAAPVAGLTVLGR